MRSNKLERVSRAAGFIFLTFFPLLTAVHELHADKAPIAYNSYDGIAPGARAMGMGYAFCAVGDDISTIYYNPAGIALLEKNYLGVSYETGHYSNLSNEQAFSSSPIRTSGLQFLALTSGKGAFSFRPLSDMTVHTVNGSDWSTTQSKIYAYTLSAARKSEDGVYAGLNISYLSGTLAESRVAGGVPSSLISDGRGLSFDIGFLYDISKYVAFGLNFENLLGTIWWDNYSKEQLPFGIKSGLSFKIPGYSIFAVDLGKEYYRDENPGPDETVAHFGFEQSFGRAVKVRLGAYGPDFNDQEKTRYTYGLGCDLNSYRLSLSGEKFRISSADAYRYVFSCDIPI